MQGSHGPESVRFKPRELMEILLLWARDLTMGSLPDRSESMGSSPGHKSNKGEESASIARSRILDQLFDLDLHLYGLPTYHAAVGVGGSTS